MEPQYSLEAGRYVFHLRSARRFDTEEVAVLFDAEHNVLLKHGEPERVQQHYKTMHESLLAGGFLAEAEAMKVVTGRFEVEELNKVITICDYVGKFWKKLQATGGAPPIPG